MDTVSPLFWLSAVLGLAGALISVPVVLREMFTSKKAEPLLILANVLLLMAIMFALLDLVVRGAPKF